MPWRSYPRELIVLVCIALVGLSPLYVANWQDGSRLALTHALALDGTVRTDAYQRDFSGDVAYRDGHYYSDKAPGLSLLALGPFEALRIAGVIGAKEERAGVLGPASVPLWVLRAATSGLMFLLAVFLVGRVAEAIAPRTGAAAATAFGLGTFALPLTPIMFGHLAGGAPAFAAFLLAWRGLESDRRRAAWMCAAGACAGTAVLFEYQTALIGLAVAAYVLARGRRLGVGLAFLAGALPPLAALGLYNRGAFGSPLHLSYRYVSSRYTDELAEGFFGIGTPTPERLWHVLVAPHGLFLETPVVIVAAAGLVLLWRRGRRGEALLCASVALAFVLYDAGFFDPYGGFSPGPRYLAPALPFLAVGLAESFRRWPLPALAVTAVSTAVMFVVTGTWDRSLDFSTVWMRGPLPREAGAVLMGTGALGALALSALPLVRPSRRCVQIVRLAPEHGAGFRRLVTSILSEFGFHEDPDIDADLADPAAHYDSVWVALAGDETVGSVAVRRVGGGDVELKRMYVRADLRGHGLGRRLLETALAWTREQGGQRIVLDTTEDMHAARHLYEQAGFRRIGSRVERGAIDRRCEILYALDLPGDHLQGGEG